MHSPTTHSIATCRQVVAHLLDRLDQDIHTPPNLTLQRHLMRCPNCRAYLDTLKKTILLYQKYPLPEMSRALRKRVHARLRMDLNLHARFPGSRA